MEPHSLNADDEDGVEDVLEEEDDVVGEEEEEEDDEDEDEEDVMEDEEMAVDPATNLAASAGDNDAATNNIVSW